MFGGLCVRSTAWRLRARLVCLTRVAFPTVSCARCASLKLEEYDSVTQTLRRKLQEEDESNARVL